MQPLSSSDGPTEALLRQLAEIAADVDTSDVIDDTSRALIVFNVHSERLTAAARFASEVTWNADIEFPGVVVTNWEGAGVASTITNMVRTPDPKGREHKVRLTFDLRFWVESLPARSWTTYIARMGPAAAELNRSLLPDVRLVVMEAALQRGSLNNVGTL